MSVLPHALFTGCVFIYVGMKIMMLVIYFLADFLITEEG